MRSLADDEFPMMHNLIKFIQTTSGEERGFQALNSGEDFYKNANRIQSDPTTGNSMPPTTAKCAVSAKALFLSLDRVLKPSSSTNR